MNDESNPKTVLMINRFRIFSLTLFLTTLVSCLSTDNDIPFIRFLDHRAEWGANSRLDLTLTPWGIYPLSEDTVFLFGQLNLEAEDRRWHQSVLLRSGDGGKQWHEVMKPEMVSDVIKITVLDDGHGWALVLRTAETPGPAYLYQSMDHGENWQKLSDIPFFAGISYPVDIQVFDKQHAQIKIYKPSYPDAESCIFINTVDGGLSWQETGDHFHGNECNFSKPTEVVALDESQWSFEVQKEQHQVIISRRLQNEDVWAEVSKIPLSFKYANGQVLFR